MPDVFVNYRTGDGDEAANILESYLTDRFGDGSIFRAVRSIQPGKPYDKSLLAGVWGCRVLLAIIGPSWTAHPGLKEEEDWVRREIIEARAANVIVIPVLKGRQADRLRAEDLPPELEWLAMMQSMILDTRDSDADLRRIGDKLSELVPALREAEQTGDPVSGSGPVRNETKDVEGPVTQVGSVGGAFTNSPMSNPKGVNSGPGDQYNYWYPSEPERKGPSPRTQRTDDLRELDERFVPPDGYGIAEAKLRDHGTVYLYGPHGSGRTTAARILLSRARRGVGTIHELPVRSKGSDGEAPLDPGTVDNGSLVWADLRNTGDWSWDEVRRFLPDVRHAILERSAYLVAVLPDEAESYEEETRSYFAGIEQPPVADVLVRHLDVAEIPQPEKARGAEFVTDQRPIREVPAYVSHVKTAKAGAPDAGIVAWCQTAYKMLSGYDKEVSELVRDTSNGHQRALMLAAAMLPNAHADSIEEGVRRLLELTGQPECDRAPLERLPLEDRLAVISAKRDREGYVGFRETGRDAVIRSYFWSHLAESREPLRTWIATAVSSEALPEPEQDTLVGNLTQLCLTDRYQQRLLELVAGWTQAGAGGRAMRAAALVLRRGLRADQASQTFRKRIYDWSRDESISIQRATVLVGACRDDMAVRDPDAALVRLLHLARRRPGLGAEEAAVALALEDRSLLRLALDRISGTRRAAVLPAEPCIFLGLADPHRFTDPGPGGRMLIGASTVRDQLVSAWETVFTNMDADFWEPRAGEWLGTACAGGDGAEALLDVLARAVASRVAAAARLYAMSRWSGFDPAVSTILRQRMTAAQVAMARDPGVREEPEGTS